MSEFNLFPPIAIQEALSKRETWENYRKYLANHKWFEENIKEIRERYKGKVVIVFNEQVVFASEDMEEIREKVRGLEAPHQAYIRYIPAENELILL